MYAMPAPGDNPVSADAPAADTDEKIHPVSLRSSYPEADSLVLEYIAGFAGTSRLIPHAVASQAGALEKIRLTGNLEGKIKFSRRV